MNTVNESAKTTASLIIIAVIAVALIILCSYLPNEIMDPIKLVVNNMLMIDRAFAIVQGISFLILLVTSAEHAIMGNLIFTKTLAAFVVPIAITVIICNVLILFGDEIGLHCFWLGNFIIMIAGIMVSFKRLSSVNESDKKIFSFIRHLFRKPITMGNIIDDYAIFVTKVILLATMAMLFVTMIIFCVINGSDLLAEIVAER
ncbi:MAG: hypothetical protein LUC38_02960 [Oscillospiraceae bacterium]|nr:hypothetical protein [Ruminococcus sp.]MCD8344905.1 hypothetical protein [Oscillospiraceae bacterium]